MATGSNWTPSRPLAYTARARRRFKTLDRAYVLELLAGSARSPWLKDVLDDADPKVTSLGLYEIKVETAGGAVLTPTIIMRIERESLGPHRPGRAALAYIYLDDKLTRFKCVIRETTGLPPAETYRGDQKGSPGLVNGDQARIPQS
jgi:hypothetical protein